MSEVTSTLDMLWLELLLVNTSALVNNSKQHLKCYRSPDDCFLFTAILLLTSLALKTHFWFFRLVTFASRTFFWSYQTKREFSTFGPSNADNVGLNIKQPSHRIILFHTKGSLYSSKILKNARKREERKLKLQLLWKDSSLICCGSVNQYFRKQ